MEIFKKIERACFGPYLANYPLIGRQHQCLIFQHMHDELRLFSGKLELD
jgi:hypothetical protein